jgi:hypothetical protein
VAVSTSASSHTTTGQVPPELIGTFAVDLDTSDVDAPDEAGNWFLALDATGGYSFGRVARGVAENTGDLNVVGGEISFLNETGDGACPTRAHDLLVDRERPRPVAQAQRGQ